MHTNYKLHEMKKAETRPNRTQNLLKITYRLKQIKSETKTKIKN